jgi:hypothetical protein
MDAVDCLVKVHYEGKANNEEKIILSTRLPRIAKDANGKEVAWFDASCNPYRARPGRYRKPTRRRQPGRRSLRQR